MNMNKTKKQIIELIEPYMEKTLGFGCYVKHERVNNGEIELLRLELEDYTYWYIEELKIIGHYDMTAVLRYIRSFQNENFYIQNENIYILDFIFPNKPLHLYTKQEEKDLLELLKYIGKD